MLLLLPIDLENMSSTNPLSLSPDSLTSAEQRELETRLQKRQVKEFMNVSNLFP